MNCKSEDGKNIFESRGDIDAIKYTLTPSHSLSGNPNHHPPKKLTFPLGDASEDNAF